MFLLLNSLIYSSMSFLPNFRSTSRAVSVCGICLNTSDTFCSFSFSNYISNIHIIIFAGKFIIFNTGMHFLNKYIIFFLLVLITAPVPAQSSGAFDSLNRILEQNRLEDEKSMKRLSSGLILWQDDPASKAVYEKMKSHIDFLSVTVRSHRDLISYYQVRDGYLDSITQALQRIRDLIMMELNPVFGDEDRALLDSEIFLQYEGIMKTLSWAQFNMKPVFESWLEDEAIRERLKEDEFYSLEGVDRILSAVIRERAVYGALQNSLEFQIQGMGAEKDNTMESLSQGDTDFSAELSKLNAGEIRFFSDFFLLDMKDE